MSDTIDKEGWREVSRSLRPDWSDEQFDAHWEEFAKLKKSVERGRRKQVLKQLKRSSFGSE